MASCYVGDLINGVRHGRGRFTYPPHGRVALPTWRPLLLLPRSGSGSLYIGPRGDGIVYEGSFVDGEMEGQGRRTYWNDAVYEGSFHRGERHGHGVMITTDERYEGEWADNKRNGYGKLILATGERIEAFFVDHRPHGRGQWICETTGCQYDGEWEGWQRQGWGIQSEENGSSYEGEWLANCREGEGCAVDGLTGLSYRGLFRNNAVDAIPVCLQLFCSSPTDEVHKTNNGSSEEIDAPEKEGKIEFLTAGDVRKLPVSVNATALPPLWIACLQADGCVVVGESGRSVTVRLVRAPPPAPVRAKQSLPLGDRRRVSLSPAALAERRPSHKPFVVDTSPDPQRDGEEETEVVVCEFKRTSEGGVIALGSLPLPDGALRQQGSYVLHVIDETPSPSPLSTNTTTACRFGAAPLQPWARRLDGDRVSFFLIPERVGSPQKKGGSANRPVAPSRVPSLILEASVAEGIPSPQYDASSDGEGGTEASVE